MAKKLPTKRRMSYCHPEHPEFVKGRGLCRACHTKALKASEALARSPAEQKQLERLAEMETHLQQLNVLTRAARAIVREHLPDYARLHYEAAKVAALKGNTAPMEWALQSVKTPEEGVVIDPPEKAARQGDGGVKVLIGINMGALGTKTAEMINVTPLDKA